MPDDRRRARGGFVTTRWSVIRAAGGERSGTSERALEELCALYWPPLYAFVRRRGHDPEAARDLTQAFFARLLERRGLKSADPARGRFRTFLLASMKNFLAGERRKASARKRGGAVRVLSMDFDAAERTYRAVPTPELGPEEVYERRWALGVLERAVADLRCRYERDGKVALFDALKGYIGGNDETLPYAELAARLGQSEGAVRTAVSRLRARWRDRLRGLVAETVDDEALVRDELRYLIAVLGRR